MSHSTYTARCRKTERGVLVRCAAEDLSVGPCTAEKVCQCVRCDNHVVLCGPLKLRSQHMMEAGVVIAGGKPVFWHLPKGRTAGSLPDSRTLWDVLWEHREALDGFAHSHPGDGWPGPSHTDVTTFLAIERALGRRLKWWITSRTNTILLGWAGKNPGDTVYGSTSLHGDEEPDWIWKLREHSYVKEPAKLNPDMFYEGGLGGSMGGSND